MKKNIITISLFVVVVIIIAFILLYDSSRRSEIAPEPQKLGSSSQNSVLNNNSSNTVLSNLEKELEFSLENGGQISLKRYNEIEKNLNNAEKRGYSDEKIQYLRNILSSLNVDGSRDYQINGNVEDISATDDENISGDNADDLIIWHYNVVDDWTPSRNPPECPNPVVLQRFVNIDLATSAIYPGQVRGGNYKSHGGFRFDNSGNDIEIRAPLDGFLWRANRFIQKGEVQYQLDIINPCGIMYRFDHLQMLPPKWMNVISQLPEPSEDSLSTNIDPPLPVTKGELLATAVGMQDNVFMDFGLYDLRQKNNNNTPDPYAICWFYLLQSPDKEKVLSLPGADFESGKESDYC